MPCMHGMSLVVVVFLVEVILYAELLGVARVPLVGMWKHHCILYSKID